MASLQEVKEFIKKSVDWLKEEDMGCTTLKLDDKLAICVGWLPGYGEEARDDVIQSASEPDFAINAGLKVWTSDDMRTDYEFINMPYYKDGEVVETDVSIEPSDEEDGYEQIAKWLLDSYEGIKDLDIDDDGLIHEDEDAIVTDREEVLTDKEKPNYVKEESLKEGVNDISDNEIFDILGIEEENREESKALLAQFRELLAKGHEPEDIWLAVDAGIRGYKVVDKTKDLVAVEGDISDCKTTKELVNYLKTGGAKIISSNDKEVTYIDRDSQGEKTTLVRDEKDSLGWRVKKEEALKEDAKNDVEQYKQAWNIVLDDFKDAYYRLVGLMNTAGFDCNEFINTKKAREAMDNSFAKKSLDELDILEWCEEVKDNINKWTPGEWLEEACKKVEKKKIKESWDGDSVIADLTERAQAMLDDREYGDMDECVQQAIDEGLIYTDDIYALAQHYGSIDDSELIESFYDDLYYDILNGLEEPEDDEDSTLDWDDEEPEETDESLKEAKGSNGEKIAKLFAKALKGECGPFGGEDPELNGNKLTLTSQGPDETWIFNDDGSVDMAEDEEEFVSHANLDDYGCEDEEELRDYYKEISHFDTIRDLLNSGLGWFNYIDEDILKKVDDILGVYSK